MKESTANVHKSRPTSPERKNILGKAIIKVQQTLNSYEYMEDYKLKHHTDLYKRL